MNNYQTRISVLRFQIDRLRWAGRTLDPQEKDRLEKYDQELAGLLGRPDYLNPLGRG